jgi:hypothetical protein
MTPSYFNPAAQPDTETQYRRGGKVNKMQKFSVAKKMPRKFGEGGKATAPAVKPAKQPSDPKLVEAAKQLEQEKRDAATQKKGAEKPVLGDYKMAKGGSVKKVRKFKKGGSTDDGIDSDESPLKKISDISGSRFGADTYARAQRFLETGEKNDDVAAATASYKQGPKKPMSDKAEASSSYSQAKQNPSRSAVKGKGVTSGGAGTEPDVPAYRRDAPTLGNRDKSGREQKFDFNAENAVTAATLIPGFGAAARLGPGVYRTGKAAYEGAKGLAEGVKSGVSIAKGLNAAEKSREAAVGAREASNRLANARAADKTKKVAEEAAKQSAKDKKDAEPIFKAAKVRADFNRIDKAAAAKKEAGFKKAAEERRASRTSDESTKMADEGNPNYKKGGSVKKYAKGGGVEAKGKTQGKVVKMAKGGMARGYGISKVTNKTKYC